MAHNDSYAGKIIAEAEILLQRVQADLNAADDFYRAQGINPEKILSACAPHMGARERQELEKLIAEDAQAIEQEVSEGKARLSVFTPASTGTPRKPRSLV